GDTIRMDVRLLDSSSLQPSELSRFVYVELTDPFGSTCRRVKLKNTGERIHGYVALPSEMAEGLYTLTGYTRFMDSTGSDYFFTKPVYIYGSGRPDNSPSFSFTRKGENLRVTTNLGNDSRPAVMEVSTPGGKTYSSLRKKRSHTFELKQEEWRKGVMLSKIGNFNLFVPLPPDSTDLRVVITPEGGNLVPNIVNTVGLRVSDSAGRGFKLNGKVIDSRGDSIASVVSDRYGFGSFRFVPETGEKYQAVIAGRNYPLSPVRDIASTLQINPHRKDAVSIMAVGNVPENAMLLIHSRGNLIHYGSINKDTPYTFRKFDLQPGVNDVCLLDGELNTISRRQVYIDSGSNLTMLLDADIPGFRTQAYGFDANEGSATGRITIDNVMLGSGEWSRYNIPSVLKGIYDDPSAELEVGGEISGTVKSRWRGKPVSDAEVSIISSDIDYWNSTRTDSNGHFILNGVDWPEGTRFVVKVVNSKGEYEDNYSIEEDSFPKVKHIVPAFDGDIYVIKQLADTDIKDRLSKWLDELEVTAMAKEEDEDDITKIYEVIGGRTLDQDYFDSRLITTYEAAIRAFPGLILENGRVTCPGGGRGKDVEIWVDGFKWTPAYDNTISVAEIGPKKRWGQPAQIIEAPTFEDTRKQTEQRKANIMTGGLLPSDLALSQYSANQSPISDLSASFPFHIVDKIIYLRPSSALIVSNHAAFAGGALMIFTKNKYSVKSKDNDIHLKVISPLGYQK
ncbi:MAG: DUF4198 domain-containing protein, partial [Muribaculaceae bacterium]|nr:DUF4198 domain-containing protein [Muribaculaceae bacterium]